MNEAERSLVAKFREMAHAMPHLKYSPKEIVSLCYSIGDAQIVVSRLEEFIRHVWPSSRFYIVEIITLLCDPNSSQNVSFSRRVSVRLSFRIMEIMGMVAVCPDKDKRGILQDVKLWRTAGVFEEAVCDEIIAMITSSFYKGDCHLRKEDVIDLDSEEESNGTSLRNTKSNGVRYAPRRSRSQSPLHVDEQRRSRSRQSARSPQRRILGRPHNEVQEGIRSNGMEEVLHEVLCGILLKAIHLRVKKGVEMSRDIIVVKIKENQKSRRTIEVPPQVINTPKEIVTTHKLL
ncbi:hypothetical protein EIN_268370 [Entamoeba invadens IP1]|uniref:CID domain-containing protein n=1 Tax=Entamoeba invadens IP1 TaxID=370355 RepID=A0A0A1U8D3_ENTIV|nr:hypothetical protein EIN_268370 [Entamoeba invadens IP1]ELP91091.1 hypothetical protein EIN_268370 [Entamoeba invadens IP1]|eukprot:XP_004257862.1 hypothetical protein EIN_268370 [Entamoeba invadens IP1]